MCIIDVFLVLRFGKTFDEDVFFVILNTTENESMGFLKTFVDIPLILKIIGALIVCNGISYVLSRIIVQCAKGHKKTTLCIVATASVAVVILLWLKLSGQTELQFRDTNVVLAYVHPVALKGNGFYETESVLKQCRDLVGCVESNPADSTIFVVVLGESHNKSHTNLYGYTLNTMPRMKTLMDSGSLVVFDNCLAHCVVTHKAIKSVMSLARSLDEVADYAIFPAVFHAAGYYTECYDNQFIIKKIGRLDRHLCDDFDVSAACYDFRNDHLEQYDDDMIETLAAPTPRSMVFININGQHFRYADRVPNDFEKPFDMSYYVGLEDYKRETFLDYDNATCYVDSVLEKIIEHYKDYNTCLLYFSDHCEDLWDNGTLGHGYSTDFVYNQRQFIPFFVWGSEKYRRTSRWDDIVAASSLPISTNDVSHVLIDLAGIKFHQFDPTRSFVNKKYKKVVNNEIQ